MGECRTATARHEEGMDKPEELFGTRKKSRRRVELPERQERPLTETVAPQVTCEAWPVCAARLVTIEPAHECWSAGVERLDVLPGAFVRVLPPTGAAPSMIESVREKLIAAGARAVRVSLGAQDAVVPEYAHPLPPAQSVREVLALVVASSGYADRDALGALVAQIADEVRL